MGANVQAMVAMVVTSDFSAMAWALGAVRLGALGRAPTGMATARAMVVAVDSLLLTAAGPVFAASRGGLDRRLHKWKRGSLMLGFIPRGGELGGKQRAAPPRQQSHIHN